MRRLYVLILILSLAASPGLGEEAVQRQLQACDLALNACGELVQSDESEIDIQNRLIAVQKAHIKDQNDAITRLEGSQSLLPGWAWGVIGGGAAMTACALLGCFSRH